ncbi:MAG: hypothetical protein ABSA54_11595 [Terriglobales bacterium]
MSRGVGCILLMSNGTPDNWLRAATEILGAQKRQKVKAAKGSK